MERHLVRLAYDCLATLKNLKHETAALNGRVGLATVEPVTAADAAVWWARQRRHHVIHPPFLKGSSDPTPATAGTCEFLAPTTSTGRDYLKQENLQE